jgi:hypothetical protein
MTDQVNPSESYDFIDVIVKSTSISVDEGGDRLTSWI